MPGPFRLKDLAAAAALIALAAALRLPRLLETPGWDGDEGYNLEIAWQLSHGRLQAYALGQSFVQHPILYYALLAPLLGFFGRDLVVARALAASVGAVAAGLVYLAARHSIDRRTATLAGIAFAAAPFIVVYHRFAYTYNLLLFWTAATLLCTGIWETTRRRRWLVALAGCASLGLLTDQVGIALPLFVAARTLPDRRLAAAVFVASIAPAVLAALAVFVVDPVSAWQDWGKSLLRVSVETPGVPQPAGGAATRLALWLVNYLHLLRAEWWMPAAVAGLFCIAPRVAQRRALALAGIAVVPTFALRELEPFFRTAVPLLVPAALGLGAVLGAGIDAVYRAAGAPPVGQPVQPRRLIAAGAVALVVVLPLGLEIARSAGALATRFETRFDWALVHDHDDARAAARFVNARVLDTEVVIASPHVAWLYEGRVVDFFQSVAWTGEPIAFYPAAIDRRRFRFDPSPAAARYAVLDSFWHLWLEASGPLRALTAEIEAWPEAFRAGQFSVRENPRRG